MAENVITTQVAKKKMVQARAGAITLPSISGMAFGSGGVDSSGNVIAPVDMQAGLSNELFRKEISEYFFVSDTRCRYICKLSEAELAGEYISELGLYDEEGDILCVKTFTKKGKDGDIEMEFSMDDIF